MKNANDMAFPRIVAEINGHNCHMVMLEIYDIQKEMQHA